MSQLQNHAADWSLTGKMFRTEHFIRKAPGFCKSLMILYFPGERGGGGAPGRKQNHVYRIISHGICADTRRRLRGFEIASPFPSHDGALRPFLPLRLFASSLCNCRLKDYPARSPEFREEQKDREPRLPVWRGLFCPRPSLTAKASGFVTAATRPGRSGRRCSPPDRPPRSRHPRNCPCGASSTV